MPCNFSEKVHPINCYRSPPNSVGLIRVLVEARILLVLGNLALFLLMRSIYESELYSYWGSSRERSLVIVEVASIYRYVFLMYRCFCSCACLLCWPSQQDRHDCAVLPVLWFVVVLPSSLAVHTLCCDSRAKRVLLDVSCAQYTHFTCYTCVNLPKWKTGVITHSLLLLLLLFPAQI